MILRCGSLFALAALMILVPRSVVLADDTARSVVAEVGTRTKSNVPWLADWEVVCRYRGEAWTIHARSVLGYGAELPVFALRGDPVDALSPLFPTQACMAIASALDPLALSLGLSGDSPRLLPPETVDGEVYKVLKLEDLPPIRHVGAGYHAPHLEDASILIYVHDGQISKIVAKLRRDHLPGEPDRTLVAKITPHYRRPETGASRKPGAAALLRIPLFDDPEVRVRAIAESPDGAYFACLSTGTSDWIDLLRVGNSKDVPGFPVVKPQGIGGGQLCFTPDGKALLALDGREGSLVTIDVATGREMRSVRIGAIADSTLLAPNGSRALIWGSPLSPCVIDCSTGQKLCELEAAPTRDATFSGDGSQLALLIGNRIFVKDTRTGRDLHSFPSRAEQLSANGPFLSRGWTMAFSPDARLLAIGNGYRRNPYNPFDEPHGPNCVYVYEIGTGRLVQTLTGMNGAVTSMGFTPDGDLLAVGEADDGGETIGNHAGVLLWETKGWRSLGAIAIQPQSAVTQLLFSPDSRKIVTVAEGPQSVAMWPLPKH